MTRRMRRQPRPVPFPRLAELNLVSHAKTRLRESKPIQAHRGRRRPDTPMPWLRMVSMGVRDPIGGHRFNTVQPQIDWRNVDAMARKYALEHSNASVQD